MNQIMIVKILTLKNFIDRNKMIVVNKNNSKIYDTSSQINPLIIKVEIKKRGRKIKNSNEKGNHNK